MTSFSTKEEKFSNVKYAQNITGTRLALKKSDKSETAESKNKLKKRNLACIQCSILALDTDTFQLLPNKFEILMPSHTSLQSPGNNALLSHVIKLNFATVTPNLSPNWEPSSYGLCLDLAPLHPVMLVWLLELRH